MRSIKAIFALLFCLMAVLAVAMFTVTRQVADLRVESHQHSEQLHRFYRLSQELKQSSDHLTKFARAYASTGNERWLRLFNQVLDVRNGKLAAPSNNDYEFWDVVVLSDTNELDQSGNQRYPSLIERIRQSGIDAVEFLELQNALSLSDQLVALEREAFMAVKGWKKEFAGEYRYTGEPDLNFARSLLYSEKYFLEKAKIMAAIGSAHGNIVRRIQSQANAADEKAQYYERISLVLVSLLLSAIIASFVLLWMVYVAPLTTLLKTVVKQVQSEDYEFTLTQKAYGELQRFIDSLNVVFHHIAEQLSFNTLVKDFNIIIRNNPTTEALCNQVTQFLLHQFPLEFIGLYIYREGVLVRVAGVGQTESTQREFSDPTTTHFSVLRSGKPYAMRSLNGHFQVVSTSGMIALNEVYYLPLHVNGQPIALLELGTVGMLSTQHYHWLSQMLDDLSVAIQLTQNAEQQRLAERKVLEQSQLNQEILDATPNPMYCLNPEGLYLTVNAKFLDLVGLARQEVIGKSPYDIFTPAASQCFSEAHRALALQQTSRNYEVSLLDQKGEQRELLVYEASFGDLREQVHGIVGILLDLTERKRMEEELRDAKKMADAMSQAKGDFLANMSHEIRTPMNAILGMAHLALNTPLDTTQRKYVTRINESAKNLLGIINDILDFSKMEAGKLHVERIDFNLDDVLDNLISVISLKAQEKGIEFLMDIDPHIPLGLIGDPLRLGQVMVNLCGNAVKFTHQGEIVISARVRQLNEQQVTLFFAVKDTGIGITQEKLAGLFNAFSQADNSITRQYGGTGLGLSISKQLVELMGGEISAHSEEGKGSTFEFSVVCGLQEAKMRDIAQPVHGLADKRVLVVDDNDSARNILDSLLTAMRFNVVTVSNGFEALSEIQQKPFDMLFVDWNMPGMNGIELLTRVKSLGLREQTKCFLVTAYGRDIHLDSENSKLVDSLIVKPVNPSNLLDAIVTSYGIDHVRHKQTEVHQHRKPNFTGQTLLLVEDNEVNQEVALGLLQETGLSVIVANNGQEALQRLAEKSFDLVLMDMQMPVMDGITATKKIRADERWKTLPIVAMTANAMATDIEHCTQAGMNDHLSKPIDVDKFYHVLKQFLTWTEPEESTAHHSLQATSIVASQKLPDGLPNLTGIDLEQAIFRIGGNQQRYFEILRHFIDSQQQELDNLSGLIAERDWEAATRVAHTLKGSSANLGFDSLTQFAASLEHRLEQQMEPNKEDIQQAQRLLNQVNDELAMWETQHHEPECQASMDWRMWYQQLWQAINDYDVVALNLSKPIRQVSAWNPTQQEALISALENFDYERAKQLLEEYPEP
ncbi:hybrid sensor histidine kinase/response regulator [Vibrio metoecus]|nr:response regulator [Vibrio metoecus]PAR37008.1 hybrid sensor histidine kinase/response regulator [Vibrio metoecus]PAR43110.1 hybrid sensor histidine kinase/response regulator [Vibrio metoecus]